MSFNEEFSSKLSASIEEIMRNPKSGNFKPLSAKRLSEFVKHQSSLLNGNPPPNNDLGYDLSVANFLTTIMCRLVGDITVTISYNLRRTLCLSPMFNPYARHVYVSRLFDGETFDIVDALYYVGDNAACLLAKEDLNTVTIDIGTTCVPSFATFMIDVAYAADSFGMTGEDLLLSFSEQITGAVMASDFSVFAGFDSFMSGLRNETIKIDAESPDKYEELMLRLLNKCDTSSVIALNENDFFRLTNGDEHAPLLEVYYVDPSYADPVHAVGLFEVLDYAYLDRIGAFAAELEMVYPQDARRNAAVKMITALARGDEGAQYLNFELSSGELDDGTLSDPDVDLRIGSMFNYVKGIAGVKCRVIDVPSCEKYEVCIRVIDRRLQDKYVTCLADAKGMPPALAEQAIESINNFDENSNLFVKFDTEDKAVAFCRCLKNIASTTIFETSWSYDYKLCGPFKLVTDSGFNKQRPHTDLMIELIKFFRTITGTGLHESKHFVLSLNWDGNDSVPFIRHWDHDAITKADREFIKDNSSIVSGPYFYW